MAQKYTFVKPKNIWKKVFSDEEIKNIWTAFMNATPLTEKEWGRTTLTKYMKETNQIVHPETDKWDDTEGVEPSHIKKFLKKYSLEDLEKLLVFLNTMSIQNNQVILNHMSDGFVSWSNIFDNMISPKFLKKDSEVVSIEEMIGYLYFQEMSNTFYQYTKTKGVYAKVGKDLTILSQIEDSIRSGLITTEINEVNISPIAFYQRRAKVWKEVKKFVPRSRALLNANPYNFGKEVLNKIEQVFGTKDMTSLDKDSQDKINIMINLFGVNVTIINPELLKSDIEKLKAFNTNDKIIKDFRPVLNKFEKVKKLSLVEIYQAIDMFKMNRDYYDMFKKKDEITINDIELYFYMHKMINGANCQEDKDTLLQLELNYWKTLKRYRVRERNDIFKMLELYEENKDNNCVIPHVEGNIGKYKYELLRKDNKLGLLLGYATDCCQTIGDNGEICMKIGYIEEESTFFAVTRGNTIMAQSWVWEKTIPQENGPDKRVICFDSVEVLGRDLEKSKSVLKAYKDVANTLVNDHGYDLVYCAIDGYRMPAGFRDLGELKDLQYVEDNDLLPTFDTVYDDLEEPFNACYTDINADEDAELDMKGIMIIAKKES